MPISRRCVLLMCIIGIYSVNANADEILVMAIFGVIGYVLRKFKFDVAPLLLAVVLGDRIELSLRRALIITNGDWAALLHGAASRVIVGAALLLLVLQSIAWLLGFRKRMLTEAEDEPPPPIAVNDDKGRSHEVSG